MKLVLLAAWLSLLCAVALAQQPQPPLPAVTRRPGFPINDSKPLPDNYQLTLKTIGQDKNASEFSLVLSSADFKADFPDAKSNISTLVGTLTPEEDGTLVFRYALGSELMITNGDNKSYKTMAFQSTVRLRPGEPVQIVKTDLFSIELTISRMGAKSK
jgi:hypothetical protein